MRCDGLPDLGRPVSAGRITRPPRSCPLRPDQYRASSATPCRPTGVITMNDKELVFLKDHLFSSPSAAGCVLIGSHDQRSDRLAQR